MCQYFMSIQLIDADKCPAESAGRSYFQMCCKFSFKTRKKTKEIMIRDGGASYALTCLRFPPTSLTKELHCLQTATSPSIPPSVFHLCRLKCFHRSDFPLVFGTRVYSISSVPTMFMMKSSFPSGNFGTSFRCAFRKSLSIPVRTTVLVSCTTH